MINAALDRDEFTRQLERALRAPEAQLFRMRIEMGADEGGQIRGYADLGGVTVLWEQRDDIGDRPVVSALINGELRFGVGMPETEGMDPLPGTITDSAVGLLWWQRAADTWVDRGTHWELTLDPANPAIADGLLPETAGPLAQRGEPLRARATFDNGSLTEVVVDALMPPEGPSAGDWTPWRTSIELVVTPPIPAQDLADEAGRAEVWRRLDQRWGA